MRGRRGDAVERLYTVLLRLYPSAFRRRYGEELMEVFRMDRARTGQGVIARARFGLRMLGDVVASVWRRWRGPMRDAVRDPEPRGRPGDGLTMDVRYAIRTLRRSPTFTLAAAATIAVGVGASTTVFSVVEAVLMRSLPFEHVSLLTAVRIDDVSASKQLLAFVRERQRGFDGVAAWSGWGFTVTGGGEPESLHGARVTADLFELMGARARLGRVFGPGDDGPGAPPLAVMSDALWQRRFGGDSGVIGGVLNVDGVEHTIIGVMPAEFRFPATRSDLWIPAVMDPANEADWRTNYLTMMGRLGSATSIDAARASMHEVVRAYREEHAGTPETFGSSIVVRPLRDHIVGETKTALLLLMAAVGLVLLIACVNVASLLVTRHVMREREMAVRAALGAGRARVARQILTESGVLALIGGAAGVALAVLGARLVAAALPAEMPGASLVRVSPTVLAFGLGVTFLCALLFGSLPASRVAGPLLTVGLRDGGRAGATVVGRRRMLGGLVIVELALAVMLVAGAAMMIESFIRLRSVETGYRADGVLALGISPPGARFQDPSALALYWDRVLEAVRAVPGVTAAGGTHILPFSGDNWNPSLRVRDREVPVEELPEVYWRLATPGYFETMGIPLLRGRAFDARDANGAPGVAVIGETLADRVFSGEDPLGREIRTGFEGPDNWVRVIGIVGDTKDQTLAAPVMPQMYRPMAQWPIPSLKLMVRTAIGEPASIAPAVRLAAWSIDADVPITDVRPFDQVIDVSVARRRLVVAVMATFGLLALVLGAVGVYGVQSYIAGQRRTEFGIRLALGARTHAILGGVLREAAVRALAGVLLGTAGALVMGRLIRAQLFATSPADPRSLISAALALLVISLLAAAGPAISAARTDPVRSLRRD